MLCVTAPLACASSHATVAPDEVRIPPTAATPRADPLFQRAAPPAVATVRFAPVASDDDGPFVQYSATLTVPDGAGSAREVSLGRYSVPRDPDRDGCLPTAGRTDTLSLHCETPVGPETLTLGFRGRAIVWTRTVPDDSPDLRSPPDTGETTVPAELPATFEVVIDDARPAAR